jgi:predicted nuclease of predicted toxin-antitoxin system
MGRRINDEEISDIAQREDRIIITFDLEFGEHFFACRYSPPGVIVLRLRDQRPERVNVVLSRFFARCTEAVELCDKLCIVTEVRTRIRRKL